MVKDTRAAGGAGTIRALKQPLRVDVKSDGNDLPIGLKLRSRWLKVEAIGDMWRIDDEWWRKQPISRMYYRCVVDQALKVTVFQDMVNGGWYRQKE